MWYRAYDRRMSNLEASPETKSLSTNIDTLFASTTISLLAFLKSYTQTSQVLNMPGKNLRLLSLDGGGVRGLSSLHILKQLMQSINPNKPPKPCEYFHMIGGTSTGG